jgi:hypothetical protein
MLYVALVPAWLWALLLCGLWLWMTGLLRVFLAHRQRWAMVLLACMGSQLVLACATAFATSAYSIGAFPCLAGMFGMLSTPVLGAMQMAGIAIVSQRAVGRNVGRDVVSQPGFAMGIFVCAVFNTLAWFAHARSALLCTV